METKEENAYIEEDLFQVYKDFLEGKIKNFNNIFNVYKEKNSTIWTDFIDILFNYPFPKQIELITNSIENNVFEPNNFLIYFSFYFIDYFKGLDDKIKQEILSKLDAKDFSYTKFLLEAIILNKESIDNYKNIFANLTFLDDFYNIDFQELLKDFYLYCKQYIEKEEVDEHILYAIKILDFISNIQDNKIEFKLYNYIRELIIDINPESIVFVLNKNLRNYKDIINIKNDLCLIFKKDYSFLKKDYEYLNFIKLVGKEIKEEIELIILYAQLLMENRLKNFIASSQIKEIKDYDIKKIILIENEIRTESFKVLSFLKK